VRLFYESHPYIQHRSATSNGTARSTAIRVGVGRGPCSRGRLRSRGPIEKPRADRESLVAGCWTSQAAIHALREPDAHVTAIDISETSLRHTRELQRKCGLRNLDLHRLAIEDVGELGRTFDQIVCTGVLHHLPDPDEGLRSPIVYSD
jgi:SAM-dependent methyltransferase